MKHSAIRVSLLAGFAVLGLVTWPTPAQQTKELRWFKGNLHTHTLNSDGDSTPDAVARWYRDHRYNFLVLSDHNYFTDPQGLNQFLAAKDKFLLLGGEEVTSRFENKPIHVNAYGLRELVNPVFADGVVKTIQGNVDAIRAKDALPSLNHPNFIWAVTPEEMAAVNGLQLFEVYNGHPGTNDEGGGGAPGLEEMWDVSLTAGKRLYGIAVDDAHSFKVLGPDLSNPGRGWVQVQATELTAASITRALAEGDFYASTGVELESMSRGGRQLRFTIREKNDRKFTTRIVGAEGRILQTVQGREVRYTLPAAEKYARATVYDSGGSRAWVQPVFGD